jgi:hypothetical protein
VATDAEKHTKRLLMIVIILSAILIGGYVGKVIRSSSEPQPSLTVPLQPRS